MKSFAIIFNPHIVYPGTHNRSFGPDLIKKMAQWFDSVLVVDIPEKFFQYVSHFRVRYKFSILAYQCFDVVLKVAWCSYDVDSELSEVCPLKFVCLFPWCMVFDEVSVKFRLDTDKHHLIKCEHHPKPHVLIIQNSSSTKTAQFLENWDRKLGKLISSFLLDLP